MYTKVGLRNLLTRRLKYLLGDHADNALVVWVLYVVVLLVVKVVLVPLWPTGHDRALETGSRRLQHMVALIRHPPARGSAAAEHYSGAVRLPDCSNFMQGRWKKD